MNIYNQEIRQILIITIQMEPTEFIEQIFSILFS